MLYYPQNSYPCKAHRPLSNFAWILPSVTPKLTAIFVTSFRNVSLMIA
jgi:hypothetical protein